ncbi:MAG TPA: lipoate--protein ligase family protein [Advenella sp.]|nr:lipoate--protein ligase family protein [Advenella sp.]
MNPPFLTLPARTIFADGRSRRDSEMQLLDHVDQQEQRLAVIHQAGQGISVPRSYQRNPHFEAASRQLAATGLPVDVRLSGGGVVPQAAGVINLHLAYPVQATYPLQQVDTHYLGLCELIARVLAVYGIYATPEPVQGSFCDGRFNLAVAGKKIAGTAQYWRRNKTPETTAGRPAFSVLSHAVILVNADSTALTDMANRFEAALHSPVRYLPEKTTSVTALLGQPVTDFEQTLLRALQNPPF